MSLDAYSRGIGLNLQVMENIEVNFQNSSHDTKPIFEDNGGEEVG